MLGVLLIQAMHSRYPDVRLHLVESLSGHLATMLHARQLDLAVLFKTDTAQRLSISPVLDEKLFVIAAPDKTTFAPKASVKLAQLADIPLILPSAGHGPGRHVAGHGDLKQKPLDLGFIALLFLTSATGLALW